MSEETFEDWIKALKFSLSIRGKACSEKAWNHQQKKIQELEDKLTRAVREINQCADDFARASLDTSLKRALNTIETLEDIEKGE